MLDGDISTYSGEGITTLEEILPESSYTTYGLPEGGRGNLAEPTVPESTFDEELMKKYPGLKI